MENDPLAAYLDALARDDCYRVAQVLKTAPHETTEVVYFVGANAAELGPFVRKRISAEAAMGDAYRHLLAAQRAGRRFRHLPRMYDVHESDGSLVVVMEYVAGRTLRDEVYACDGSPAVAARWFPMLCDGVMELHEQFPAPLIHRDLKPSNVLVGKEGLTIIDFGIARAFREGAEGDTARFGTRSYAPPEQFGYGQTDVRSDVYALGMLLYYLLTERDPSPAVATAGFVGPEVPAALRPVLMRACAFDPAARYQSVRELKEAFLEAVAPLMPVASTAPGPAAAAAAPAAGTGGPACVVPAVPVQPALGFESAGVPDEQAPVGPAPARPKGAFHPAEPNEALSALRRASIVLGVLWDVAVFLVWLLLVVCCIGAVIFPNEADRSVPLAFRVAEYGGFGALFFTGIAYMLLDKRLMRNRIPLMRGQTFLRGLVPGALVVAVSFVVMSFCIFFVAIGVVELPSYS